MTLNFPPPQLGSLVSERGQKRRASCPFQTRVCLSTFSGWGRYGTLRCKFIYILSTWSTILSV